MTPFIYVQAAKFQKHFKLMARQCTSYWAAVIQPLGDARFSKLSGELRFPGRTSRELSKLGKL